MTDFDVLDAYLAGQFADDYWNEDGLAYARSLVRTLSADGWDQLHTHWPTRPTDWQRRAAEIFSTVDPQYAAAAVQFLVEMVAQAREQEVALAAADALRSFEPVVARGALSDAGWKRLEAVERGADARSVTGLVVHALLNRLRGS